MVATNESVFRIDIFVILQNILGKLTVLYMVATNESGFRIDMLCNFAKNL